MKGSHGAIIRCTSNSLLECGRSAFTTSGPMVMFGHEMPVHDIDMDPVAAGLVDGAHLLAEPAKSAERIDGAMMMSRAIAVFSVPISLGLRAPF